MVTLEIMVTIEIKVTTEIRVTVEIRVKSTVEVKVTFFAVADFREKFVLFCPGFAQFSWRIL